MKNETKKYGVTTSSSCASKNKKDKNKNYLAIQSPVLKING